MFARRAAFDLTPNELSLRLARRRAQGLPVLDLTESNPTRCGFPASAAALAEALEQLSGDPHTGVYAPEPKGSLAARKAVAHCRPAMGAPLDPAQIVLTAGTSEGYAHLFRLLADPGDEVLVPRPSYPLFDHLASFEGVTPIPYPLRLDERDGWRIDLDALRRAVTPRTRALLAVHPNNPTGSFVRHDEVGALRALCRERGLALVSDEVFSDYRFDPKTAEAGAAAWPHSLLDGGDSPDRPLTFVLSGLSKTLGLPQLKIGWIAVSGPRELRDTALERLELIADTFLSVSGLAQACVPELLRHRAAVQATIQERLRENREWLAGEVAAGEGVELLPADGGWYAVLRVPARAEGGAPDEERLAAELLDGAGVLVHPGYFFDFPEGAAAHLVVSLLPPSEIFGPGVQALCEALRGGTA